MREGVGEGDEGVGEEVHVGEGVGEGDGKTERLFSK